MITILVIIFLSLLILIHELGHFSVAKFFKVRVDEFGLGFPPRAWAKKKGETEYSINWLPFGGFVKIYGENEVLSEPTNVSESTNELQINNDHIIEKELSYKLTGIFFRVQKELGCFAREKQYGDLLEQELKRLNISYQREVRVSVGNEFSNIIDFLIEGRVAIELKAKPFILKEDYFQIKRYIESTNLELGIIVNFHDRYLKPKRVLNSKTIRSDSDHSDEFVASDRDRSFVFQSFWKKSAILLAGVFMNAVLGWAILAGVFMVGIPEHLMIADVAKDAPAYMQGIKKGDIVLEAKFGDAVLQDPLKSDLFISLVNKANGKPLVLLLQRNGNKISLEATGRANPPKGEGSLGVSLAEVGFPAYSFWQSLGEAFSYSWFILKSIVIGFVSLFINIFTTPNALEGLSGPIGIFAFATQAGSLGIAYLLQLIALISLNLTVLNLLPFPALDGGRFLLLIIEKIKGSPLSHKVQMVLNVAGFALIAILMIVVSIQDVGRLIR